MSGRHDTWTPERRQQASEKQRASWAQRHARKGQPPPSARTTLTIYGECLAALRQRQQHCTTLLHAVADLGPNTSIDRAALSAMTFEDRDLLEAAEHALDAAIAAIEVVEQRHRAITGEAVA